MSEDLDSMVDDILGKQKEREEKAAEKVVTKGEYPALMAFSNFYKILAWIWGIAFLLRFINGFLLLLRGRTWEGLEMIIIALVFGSFVVITCLAITEGIKIFIRIERNTDKQVTLLEKLLNKQ